MTWLYEANLLLVLLGGVIVVAILLGAMFNTGQKRYLALSLLVVLMTGCVLLVSWAVESPQEEVESTLKEIAGHLERNDHAGVLSYISPTKPLLRAQAQAALALAKLDDVKITPNLEIHLEPERNPPLAEATFNARFHGSFGGIENQSGVQAFRVLLRKEDDGQWRIYEYERSQPNL